MKKRFLLQLLVLSCTTIGNAINPSRTYQMKPDQLNIKYEEHKIKTADGAALNAWIMESQVEERKELTFVIVGSDAGNMGYSLSYAAFLLNSGYDVVTFDYRGFGESSDFEHRPDFMYHNEYIDDFVAVNDWIKAQLSPKKIGVLAFSMGTLIASAGFERSRYDLLVGEAFIKSPRKNAKRLKRFKDKKIKLPSSAKSTGKKIREVNVPILLFASSSDKITTLKDSREVVARKKHGQVIAFDGEHLRGAFTLGIKVYIDKIVAIAEQIGY